MKRSATRGNEIEVVGRANGEDALLIKGRWIDASQTQIAVLATLLEQKGQVVTYERLCRAIGHELAQHRQKHILRQYVGWAKQTLAAHKTSYVIAVVKEEGYALCPMASH